jgi:hypothetical protein
MMRYELGPLVLVDVHVEKPEAMPYSGEDLEKLGPECLYSEVILQ